MKKFEWLLLVPDYVIERFFPWEEALLLYTTLFDFLLQLIEFRGGEELRERNVQAVADHFDRKQFRILALAVKDVLDAGGRQRAYRGQLIDAHISFFAQLQDAGFDCRDRIHSPTSIYF